MYDKVIEFVKAAGERLREKAGNIPDIGVAKRFLTEEDLRIEREFGELIKTFGPDHQLYAEEEHDVAWNSEHVWVMDPISGTSTFVRGLPHYAIVVSHIHRKSSMFAVVYDPSMRDMYHAEKDKGMFLNAGKKIVARTDVEHPRILVSISATAWNQPDMTARFASALQEFNMLKMHHSDGIEYGYVASGKFDGMINLTKDTFPDFAGSLLVREAGGTFTNGEGSEQIKPTDRVFVAAHPSIHFKLLEITRAVLI